MIFRLEYDAETSDIIPTICFHSSTMPNLSKTSAKFSTTLFLHFQTVVSLSMKVPYFSLHIFRIGLA